MSFDLFLYRAPEGLGPWSTWTEMHAQPLGTRREVQAQIDTVFRPQRWELSADGAWACYEYDDARLPREIRLTGAEDEVIRYLSIYSAPPAVRALMLALGLNYCYAPESDVLYRPFEAAEHWPGEN